MHSKFLDWLNEGEILMADRGFELEEKCIKKNIRLEKPPEMKKGKKHLTPREGENQIYCFMSSFDGAYNESNQDLETVTSQN